MSVLISNSQTRLEINLEKIRKTAQAVLNALACPDDELSILIVDDPQIEKLNQQHLNRTGPTNVIAFAMHEGEFPDLSPHLLGDVVISTDTAASEAQTAAISMEQRFDELLAHGILHLMGYDHETSEEEARLMENKSREILALLYDD